MLVFDGFNERDFKHVANLLVAHGVEHLDATRYLTALIKQKTSPSPDPTSFFELYGQGGLQRAAKLNPGLNVRGLEVLDLRTLRPDGQAWDFTRAKGRAWALKLIRKHKPMWVIAAPHAPRFPF